MTVVDHRESYCIECGKFTGSLVRLCRKCTKKELKRQKKIKREVK